MPASTQQTPTPPLVGGNSVRTTTLKDYVFQSGFRLANAALGRNT